MEIRLAEYFDFRANLIVPNVSWGLINHECDLLILSKAGYASEIEIKISRSDLLADKKKKHGHCSNKIKFLWFAIPENIDIEFALHNIPDRAGLIIVPEERKPIIKKNPVLNKLAKQFSVDDKFQLARLGAMRIWGLKRKVVLNKKLLKMQMK
jgi:hypothetical protein